LPVSISTYPSMVFTVASYLKDTRTQTTVFAFVWFMGVITKQEQVNAPLIVSIDKVWVVLSRQW